MQNTDTAEMFGLQQTMTYHLLDTKDAQLNFTEQTK